MSFQLPPRSVDLAMAKDTSGGVAPKGREPEIVILFGFSETDSTQTIEKVSLFYRSTLAFPPAPTAT